MSKFFAINFTRELVERADEIVDLFYRNFGDDRRFCFSFIPVFDWSYKDSDFMRAEQLKKELIHEEHSYHTNYETGLFRENEPYRRRA